MPTCTNTTWMDGADIKSKNWQGKGGYRSKYDCGTK